MHSPSSHWNCHDSHSGAGPEYNNNKYNYDNNYKNNNYYYNSQTLGPKL